MRQKKYIYFSSSWTKQYAGKYIAVLDDKVIGVGRDSIEAFEKLKEKFPEKKEGIGIYYIPTPKELITCLLNTLI